MKRNKFFVLFIILGAISSGSVRATGTDAPESFTLSRGVVVELGTAPKVFVSHPANGLDYYHLHLLNGGRDYRKYQRAVKEAAMPSGLDAFDLGTGKRLWHHPSALMPLLVRQGRLLVVGQALIGKEGVPLLILDASTGKAMAKLPLLDVGQ